MLRILGLFDLGRPVITPEWLMAELGVSRASIYRDLGMLAQAGMLERVADRGYVLGPKVAPSVSYERGRAMPQYRGATSKIILACLPQAQLRHLWAAERETLVAAGLPDDYAQLVKVLAGIRKTGYFIAEGEVDPNAVGFAVPLKDSARTCWATAAR